MNNLLKKGLAALILGTASISASGSHDLYFQEQNKNYSNKILIDYQNSRDGSIDLVFVGLTTLGAYYAIKRLRNKQ